MIISSRAYKLYSFVSDSTYFFTENILQDDLYIAYKNVHGTVFASSQIKCSNRRTEPMLLFLFLLADYLLSNLQMEEESNKMFCDGRPF